MARADETTREGVDIDGMADYLDETEVVFAVLFGSYAREASDEASDVDIAVRFPDDMDKRKRFRARNRVDAALQEYTDGFVDVSDVESLPTEVAHAALQEGVVLIGEERLVDAYRTRVRETYESDADDRERERREFIDRLARGET